MKAHRLILIVLSGCVAGLAFSCAYSATVLKGETLHSISDETGLATWETENRGIHFRLTQISREQAQAFMLARGMDAKSADEFAGTCVFMSVLRNDSKKPIKYCLAEWRYAPIDDTPQLMLTKHDWLARWQPRNFSKPVKTAFEWSQFPVEQTFSPGDWNQGMTTYEIPPGTRFDVTYRWWQGGKLHEGTLRNVECHK
jgi:hypothetical protein